MERPWTIVIGVAAALAIVISLIANAVETGTKSGNASPISSSDATTIEQLTQAGDSFTKPRKTDFYLYFPSREAALNAETQLKPDGYGTNVSAAAEGKSYLCLASKDLIPNPATIGPISTRLESICKELGGEYDGWETKVER